MTRYFQVRLEEDEYDEFSARVKAAGFESLQAAGREAVLRLSAALGEVDGPEGQVPPRLRPYVKESIDVLSSGNDTKINALVAVLKAVRLARK